MRTYARYVLVRLASAVLTLLGVSLVIFAAIHAMPGSFEEVLMPQAAPELRARLAAEFGLDQPLPIQYFRWISSLASGDLGISLMTRQPVWIEFAERIPITMELATLATTLAIAVGIPLGLWSGLAGHQRGAQAVGRLGAGLAMSVPDFVLGSVLLYLFSKYSLGLTVGTWVSFDDDPVGNLRAVALPAITLSTWGIGLLMATTRHAVLTILAEGYITAAVARGERPSQIVRQHILRNAGIPVVTVIAIFTGYLLGGTVIVETLYSVPGLGRHLVQAVLYRDYPIVQAGVLLTAAFFVMLNMLADLAYAGLDPRLSSRT